MYSYRVEQAIRAAAILHKNQFRKGSAPIPYITHLYAVAMIVSDYTDDEDALVGALLHDTLEDTDYKPDELREDFGDKVLEIVKAVTEPQNTKDQKYTWTERKKHYSKQLKTAPEAALIIAAADKIHNMRCSIEEYFDYHERFIKDFGKNVNERAFMYQDVSNILNSRLKNPIISEFNHVYTEYKDFIAQVEQTLKNKLT